MKTRFVVYRVYDNKQLLYIGATQRFQQRMWEHYKSTHWWPENPRVTKEYYLNRKDMLEAETFAINLDKPVHNVKRRKTAKEHAKLFGISFDMVEGF